MRRRKLLIAGQESEVGGEFFNALESRYEVVRARSVEDTLDTLAREPVGVVFIDMAMTPDLGEAVIRAATGSGHETAILAAWPRGSDIEAASQPGMSVYDVVDKPFKMDRVLRAIERAWERVDLKTENRNLHLRLRQSDRLRPLVGNSVPMQRIREKLRMISATRATVLVTGESGTGKEVVAREIHRMSDRYDRPFVKVNCASIPEMLLEGELFGYDKGPLAGSVRPIAGKFELADSGTILLDEIGRTSATIQAKLLRVIEDGEFDPVGGSTPVKVDVRVIATTKENMRKEIKNRNFREDLFYLLNVVPIEMPPLRERREDIPLLISHFIEIYSVENNRPPIRVTDGAVKKLSNAYWRGNVRELENVIERAVILGSGATLDETFFEFDDARDERISRLEETFRHGSIRDMEKLMIMYRLLDNEQNRTRSAKTLDISVRTLRNKLREYRDLEMRNRQEAFFPPRR